MAWSSQGCHIQGVKFIRCYVYRFILANSGGYVNGPPLRKCAPGTLDRHMMRQDRQVLRIRCVATISNGDKKALLPFLGGDPGSLHDGIDAGQADPLGGGGALEAPPAVTWRVGPGGGGDAVVGAMGLVGFADGEEDGAAHEQGGLADAAAPLDGAQVLPLDALEQGDVEDLGDVAEAGDLVGAGPMAGHL